ncbi:hypothetical protein [Scytonema sp. NUACC26]|uniref:hypothetical protein n=1 Tax=Scytonema sp. NUACC26 TaxID=3140176 RepID=UPI0034DC6008
MDFTSELQQEVEQWAKSLGLSTEQFVVQAVSEKLSMLKQQRKNRAIEPLKTDALTSRSEHPRLYRKHGVLVIETGQLNEFDINAFISEMREERIQEQIGKMRL